MEVSSNMSDKFCNHTYERMVLSASLKNMDIFYNVISKIESEDFLSDDNKIIFLILKELQEKGSIKFDLNIIADYAKSFGTFDLMGGYDYLLALDKMDVDSSLFEEALNGMLDHSTKFKLYSKLNGSLKELLKNTDISSEKSAVDLIGSVQSSILDLSIKNKSAKDPIHVASGLKELLESRNTKKVEVLGISTGYPILDHLIDGLIPGTLFIIAARKKQGKSTILTNMAVYSSVLDNKSVLYIDTEMTFAEWRDRVLSIISGVEERDIKHGGYDEETYMKLLKAADILEKSKLFHQYMPGYNLDKITALYKKFKIKEDIDLAVFDYIKEPELKDNDFRKEHKILGDVTTKLKDLAGELNIPYLAAVQLNREGDVADSDRIARYGDIVAFWGARTEKEIEDSGLDPYKHGFYSLKIKDSRRGGDSKATGIGFHFWHSTLRITEVKDKDQFHDFKLERNRPEMRVSLNE